MITIASEVRRLFLMIMRDEIFELEERADTLLHAELFDAQLKSDLASAFERIRKARMRVDELLERTS